MNGFHWSSSCVYWLHLFVVWQLAMRLFLSEYLQCLSSRRALSAFGSLTIVLFPIRETVCWRYRFWQRRIWATVHFVPHLEQCNLKADGECAIRLIRCKMLMLHNWKAQSNCFLTAVARANTWTGLYVKGTDSLPVTHKHRDNQFSSSIFTPFYSENRVSIRWLFSVKPRSPSFNWQKHRPVFTSN